MPTPVTVARQFLTDEAARALDDAVTVARRRSHSQTTSLHAVSALLSLPSSSLREACSRAPVRFPPHPSFSHRLQFRALELSVCVSLDRLPSSKGSTTEEPPISNSLMTAIKRSQANQRRHPESFHLFNQYQNGTSSSMLKVELKHFVVSILDDPIVNRVFDEAGFRSCDVKLALLQPPPQVRSSSMKELCSKSSLMGSFVPFGGFFSTPSESKNLASSSNASFTRCDKCNEKYEQEVANVLKVDPTTLSSSCSTSLPWFKKDVDVDTHGGLDVAKTNEENTSLNDKILGFQKKWNDICQQLHQTRAQVLSLEGFRCGSGFIESSSKDPSLNGLQCSNTFSFMPKNLDGAFPSKKLSPALVHTDTISVDVGTDHVQKDTETQEIDLTTPWAAPSRMANSCVLDNKSSSSLTSVATDLGLGTLYTSTPNACKPDTPRVQDKIKHFERVSDSASADCVAIQGNTSHQIARSSCSVSKLSAKFDSVDFKSLNKLLFEKVGWQDQAICDISRTLFLRKSGEGKSRDSHGRADIWFAFLGPDRVGKKKIASALAEAIFGNTESVISLDLGFQDRFSQSNSIFECQKSFSYDVIIRKTVVDYIAGELSKNPHSVVFLDNVDKADFLVRSSLLQAIRRGKFPDSRGREISISKTIFLLTSSVCKGNGSSAWDDSKMFCEETVLEAKRYQMQLLLGDTSEDAKRSCSTNIKIVSRKGFSKPSFPNKRKQVDISDFKEEETTSKMQKQVCETSIPNLDLNMPLEEHEEGMNDNDREHKSVVDNSDSWFSDLCNQMDEKVVFKPFHFDELAQKLLKNISIQFERAFGSEFQLEIDYEVMTQILAAAWLADKKNSAEDWVESVLGKSFFEAQKKYHPADKYVVKLINCESIFVEDPDLGACLPASINMK
ncbi:protein SMAX1-LIKE 7-like [Vicia villosa]|uniref:protein SMAX1-LIKE 7-like n=1 Tax=Vicia villosa TaxID=3911 RepID=UPI00273B6507|nr:protein SMAX1-LIKE 7-like [Vicia villosa]